MNIRVMDNLNCLLAAREITVHNRARLWLLERDQPWLNLGRVTNSEESSAEFDGRWRANFHGPDDGRNRWNFTLDKAITEFLIVVLKKISIVALKRREMGDDKQRRTRKAALLGP